MVWLGTASPSSDFWVVGSVACEGVILFDVGSAKGVDLKVLVAVVSVKGSFASVDLLVLAVADSEEPALSVERYVVLVSVLVSAPFSVISVAGSVGLHQTKLAVEDCAMLASPLVVDSELLLFPLLVESK